MPDRVTARAPPGLDVEVGHRMRRVGDRRGRVRLDVVGALWGTLETSKRAQVLNISDTGALLLSPVHLPANTVHTLQMTHHGLQLEAEVLVRHVRPASVAGAYQVGVEFLAPPPSTP
jgi:hypothetical protein